MATSSTLGTRGRPCSPRLAVRLRVRVRVRVRVSRNPNPNPNPTPNPNPNPNPNPYSNLGHFLHQLDDYSRALSLLEAHEG